MVDVTSGSSRDDAKKELLKRVDDVLWEGAYDTDVRSTALIGYELGELLRDGLDDQQKAALDAAKLFWFGNEKNEQERLAFVEKIGARRDRDMRDGTSQTRRGYINQVIWTALNTNTGLSGFAGEFLVEIAEGSGLGFDQIAEAFEKILPVLRESK